MLPKIIDKLGNEMTNQKMISLLAPSLFFWLGGLLLLWPRIENWYKTLAQPIQGWEGMILIEAFLLITISAIIVQRFDLSILRLLSGYYWPKWLVTINQKLIQRVTSTYNINLEHYRELVQKGIEKLSHDEYREFIRLDQYIRYMPCTEAEFMPTTLGNILRAAELRPRNKYGLDMAVCWPRLWLLLSNDVKKELSDARTAIDAAIRLITWSMLFLIWSFWAWWAIVIALIIIIFAYRWTISIAKVYADLIDSTYDLYRNLLYSSLRWPLPKNPAEEPKVGLQITEYLWRGSDASTPIFTDKT
jgi:hypothetical protein